MSLPDVADRAWESALPPAQHGPLAQLAANSFEAGYSGLRLIGSGSAALQARLALIEGATRSLDLQVYQFKTDASGRALMRALRDAAARGVRVRVLVDDLYTAGDDGCGWRWQRSPACSCGCSTPSWPDAKATSVDCSKPPSARNACTTACTTS